nr:hypothetical protein [uncultured Fusobacterium sp.]
MSIITKRIHLEKKYSNYCLYYKIPLPEVENRILSVSPSGYYYHTGINADPYDNYQYKALSKKAHIGKREEIENEVGTLIDLTLFEGYFFDIKNEISCMSLDELNSYLLSSGSKALKKYQFNRLQKLFRKWTEESIKCHYKITGAKKRIHKKLKKLEEINE